MVESGVQQVLGKAAAVDDAKRGRRTPSAPAVAKAVAVLGPAALTPLLTVGPYRLFKHFESGRSVAGWNHGLPIEESGAFRGDELRRIGDFARAQGVDIPIRTGARSAHMPDTPMTRGIGKLFSRLKNHAPEIDDSGVRAALQPRIELSSTSVPVAMHEIGHATKPMLGQAWRGFSDLRHVLPLAQLPIALKALTPPDEHSSATKKFVYNHAPALMVATSAPTLLEEARASMHALRGAQKFGPGVAQTLKELVPAYGTYVAAAAAPALAVALAQRLAKHLLERGKHSEPGPGAVTRN